MIEFVTAACVLFSIRSSLLMLSTRIGQADGGNRSALPSAHPRTLWLADLIEATEVVAASAGLAT